MVVSGAGHMYAFGSGADGRLGTGSDVDRALPMRIPSLPPVREAVAGYAHTVIVTESGEVSSKSPPQRVIAAP